jgi:3-(3-hydroxy-phenyl)propionate hydroxylase
VPIFGVRGLNSGLADAMNAAWKLAYVIRGWAPPTLLDSYSVERRGATLDVFRNATRSTLFMTPPTRGYQLLRTAALSLALHDVATRPLINPRQSRPYSYVDSPLTTPTTDIFEAGPVAGAPLINRRLGSDLFLLDRLGLGFSGLYFTASGEVPQQLRQLFEELTVGDEVFQPIIISSRSGGVDHTAYLDTVKAYGATEGTFYLVRPDRHVAARWQKVESRETRQALDRALAGQA